MQHRIYQGRPIKTLDQLRKILKKEVDPSLELHKNKLGGCYYYFDSNDPKIQNYLLRLETTSVLVYHWSHLPIEMWIQDAKEILETALKLKEDDSII